MIACFDVHYFRDFANAAAIVLNDWADARAGREIVVRTDAASDYVAGSFYQRELTPLVAAIQHLDLGVHTYVIDAYCHLDSDGSPGLGAHLHKHLPAEAIVIGVAKNRFRDTKHAIEVLRGDSVRPLFVTSIGIEYSNAAACIQSMHGKHRFPTLLKRVDQLARDQNAGTK